MKLKSSRTVYQDRWVRLILDEISHPSGPQSYIYLERLDPGSVIVPVDSSGNLILVNQYRHPIKKNIWQFPGGTIEPGESPLENANKELLEETGYHASKWIDAGKYYPDPGILGNVGRIFIAQNLKQISLPQNTDQENTQVKAFTIDQIDQMVKIGKIRDGWTLAAMYMYRLYAKNDQQA